MSPTHNGPRRAKHRKLVLAIEVHDQHDEPASAADLQEWLQWLLQSDDCSSNEATMAVDISSLRVTQARVVDLVEGEDAPRWAYDFDGNRLER